MDSMAKGNVQQAGAILHKDIFLNLPARLRAMYPYKTNGSIAVNVIVYFTMDTLKKEPAPRVANIRKLSTISPWATM